MYYKVLLCTTMWYKGILCTTKCHSVLQSTTLYYTLCLPRKITLTVGPLHVWNARYNARSNKSHPPLHQILRVPRTLTLMIDPAHIWNVIYHARSNSTHRPTSPSTEAATKNDCGPSHINVIYGARSNKSHPPTSPNTARVTKNHSDPLDKNETSCAMRGATRMCGAPTVTLQRHQNLRLPRKITFQNMKRLCWKRMKRHLHCRADPSMIQAWTAWSSRGRPFAEVTFRTLETHFGRRYTALRLSNQISPKAAPAAKSDAPTSPNAAPATKSDTPTSPNVAPAMKSETPTSPNTAPASNTDSHDWFCSHMKRHLPCAEQQHSPSNVTKYCACHAK